jgi:hypothetical protein
MSPNDNGGRITTREFYTALLDQNKERADMEGRLGDKIDLIHSDIAANNEKLEAHDKRISSNSTDIKKVGGLNAIATVIASTIAGVLGTRQ